MLVSDLAAGGRHVESQNLTEILDGRMEIPSLETGLNCCNDFRDGW